MATTLYLLDSAADTHLGSNHNDRAGVASGWIVKALGTERGSGVVASDNVATTAGAAGGGAGNTITSSSTKTEWLSPPVAADVTISGTITANIWALESSMNANVAINVEIYLVRANALGTANSNTLESLVPSTRVTEVAITTRAVNNFTTGMTSGAYSSLTLNRGDRLRVIVFGSDAGTMASGFTFNVSWNGATAAADGDSYVTFTENITFESPSAGGVGEAAAITQSSASEGQINFGSATFQQKLAQSFTAPGPITRIELWLSKNGSPADNVTIELQSDSSGPSGTVLASQTISAASLSATTPAWWSFALSYATTASTLYWIVLSRSGAFDAVNVPRVGRATGNPYADGASRTLLSSGWNADETTDLAFIVYQSASTTLYLTNAQSGLTGAPALISSFTGADENPLSEGGNWANVNSAGTALQRISSAVASTAGSTGNFYWTPANFGPDLEIYATISTVSTTFGVAARIQGEGGAGTWDGYRADVTSTATTLRRVDNSALNTLISVSTTWSDGDKVGLRCEGSTIQAWRQASGSSDWNLVCTAVDATYAGAGKIGVCAGTTVGRLDDLYAATDSNLFTQKAWTSRGSGVVSYLSDTDAGWVSPLLTAEWFTPQLQAVTLTGLAQANIRALESNASANASLRCEIARVESDGSSPTVWASWPMSSNNGRTGELNTSESAETINISGDDLAITDGQRLRIRLYNDDMPTTAMGNGFTVQRFYNGTSGGASGDSYITLPVTLTALGGGTTYTKAGYGKESG